MVDWLRAVFAPAWRRCQPALVVRLLVMTIAAERLEMTRLDAQAPWCQRIALAAAGVDGTGRCVDEFSVRVGGVLYGLSLLLLALWLECLTSHAARCLPTGWPATWPGVCSGLRLACGCWLAWTGSTPGLPLRDMALHALGLGFIVSMMLGHAPVILPPLHASKLNSGVLLYLPLVAFAPVTDRAPVWGLDDPHWRATGRC